MLIRIDNNLKSILKNKGIENFQGEGVNISDECLLEPPCSIKWMQIENHFSMGAFSYAVSGYYSNVEIGRYTSIGEQVQIGRGNHSTSAVSTSPFFYLNGRILDIGREYEYSTDYESYVSSSRNFSGAESHLRVSIGNDVWIGHGAFIRPGVTIGDGAIIGAMSVVTKNVPAYGIVAGNPATLKKFRLPIRQAADLQELKWWRFAPWQLSAIDFAVPIKAVEMLKDLSVRTIPYLPEKISISNLMESLLQEQKR